MSPTIHLSDSEIVAIQSKATEGGGFQSLFKKLSGEINGNNLTVDEETAQRTIDYFQKYGGGGWQDALESIVSKLRVE